MINKIKKIKEITISDDKPKSKEKVVPYSKGKEFLRWVKNRRRELKEDGYLIEKWFYDYEKKHIIFKVRPIEGTKEV